MLNKKKKTIILIISISVSVIILLVYLNFRGFFGFMMINASHTDIPDFYNQYNNEFEIIKDNVLENYSGKEIIFEMTKNLNINDDMQKAINTILDEQERKIIVK